jgi:hypothetical protein
VQELAEMIPVSKRKSEQSKFLVARISDLRRVAILDAVDSRCGRFFCSIRIWIVANGSASQWADSIDF